MTEEVQESLQKLSTNDSDSDDDVAEPPLARRTTFGGAGEHEDDEEDIMPMPSTLARATSEPIGSPKSPFSRQKRRNGRKSLRQQNPNHKLHAFLPPEMQESEATDEVSALTRAKEKRKLILEQRRKEQEEEEQKLLHQREGTATNNSNNNEEEQEQTEQEQEVKDHNP
mmetsp:Transcript_27503/g.66809  ORF Transcript_27503/g.66809 Transcript_27503/m.66809 type:complete len:169 (+) Transcript_27503:239-745(+)